MTRSTPLDPVDRLVAAQLVDGGQQVALAGHVGEEDQPGLVGQARPAPWRGWRRRGRRRSWPRRPARRGGRPRPCSGRRPSACRSASARSCSVRFGAGAGAPARRLRDGVDQVAEHGAGRRAAAGAAAVEHELAADRALDEHGVEGAPHRGQRVRLGHHGGVDPDRDLGPAVDQLGDGQQLDRVAEPAGVGDVGRADRR